MHLNPAGTTTRALVDPAQAALSSQLHEGENVLAQVSVDLTEQLFFASTQLFVTNLRVLARPEGGKLQDWPLAPGMALKMRDQAGVGSLDLVNATGLLARWFFTHGRNVAVLRWVAQFEQAVERLGQPPKTEALGGDEVLNCPSCHASRPPDSESCPVCSRELHSPPSTWVLLRLGQFAKPYRAKLILGFLLTLASTAATLVPTYLTIPLLDDVLVPYQSGKPIDPQWALLLLSGLLALRPLSIASFLPTAAALMWRLS